MWQNLHFLAPERDRTVFLEEVVESAEILTEEGERRRVGLDYFRFGYDYSILHERDDVVLTATFRLEPTPARELRRVIRENLRWRDDRHPDLWLYPCAGSIFQKIEGIGAGPAHRRVRAQGSLPRQRPDLPPPREHHREPGWGVVRRGARAHRPVAGDGARETGYELVPEIVFVGEF